MRWLQAAGAVTEAGRINKQLVARAEKSAKEAHGSVMHPGGKRLPGRMVKKNSSPNLTIGQAAGSRSAAAIKCVCCTSLDTGEARL
ncbi:hypothetical protein IscW_ISCW012757 [Ixodes scapularis]|uniref:Uncharacterized protein n=1 Tax=Ixodes scapularis TaxID=6945 RepID=B7QB52_IXOSC|nr:hypothetical protein IscW_ISCW012757 [Ixodes scapularis]|eukprot:XP_002412778.1 hypothetical protein IscW_ISCW012757 [Ixodes scapularis]